jgi:hypothetical protein
MKRWRVYLPNGETKEYEADHPFVTDQGTMLLQYFDEDENMKKAVAVFAKDGYQYVDLVPEDELEMRRRDEEVGALLRDRRALNIVKDILEKLKDHPMWDARHDVALRDTLQRAIKQVEEE